MELEMKPGSEDDEEYLPSKSPTQHRSPSRESDHDHASTPPPSKSFSSVLVLITDDRLPENARYRAAMLILPLQYVKGCPAVNTVDLVGAIQSSAEALSGTFFWTYHVSNLVPLRRSEWVKTPR